MESGRIFFDPSCQGNMLFLGNGESFFQGERSVMNVEETSRRRPFFSTAEEIYDEEYYDDQLPEKKRRLTPEQVHSLEKSFEVENKLEPERKAQLAKKLGLQPRQVAVWFQNRRARWKTKQLERDYDQLKSSYDSLVSNFESVSKENDKLKAEVLYLMEKMKAGEQPAGESPAHHASNHVPTDVPPCLQLTMKVEDRQSMGSDGGSAVVDDECPQLLDSGDSYFPSCHYPDCMVAAEEDDGSDNGDSYFEYVFPATEQQQQHHQEDGDGEPIGWFIWT